MFLRYSFYDSVSEVKFLKVSVLGFVLFVEKF